jgi:hypothetical protein
VIGYRERKISGYCLSVGDQLLAKEELKRDSSDNDEDSWIEESTFCLSEKVRNSVITFHDLTLSIEKMAILQQSIIHSYGKSAWPELYDLSCQYNITQNMNNEIEQAIINHIQTFYSKNN